MQKKTSFLLSILLLLVSLISNAQEKTDQEYTLEASMLGYFAKDGTRNPTLKANKGDIVKIRLS